MPFCTRPVYLRVVLFSAPFFGLFIKFAFYRSKKKKKKKLTASEGIFPTCKTFPFIPYLAIQPIPRTLHEGLVTTKAFRKPCGNSSYQTQEVSCEGGHPLGTPPSLQKYQCELLCASGVNKTLKTFYRIIRASFHFASSFPFSSYLAILPSFFYNPNSMIPHPPTT